MQMMMNAKGLPVAQYDDYSVVFNFHPHCRTVAGGQRMRQFIQLGRPALKIGDQRSIAAGGSNPIRELPLFACGLLVQQPHVVVSE